MLCSGRSAWWVEEQEIPDLIQAHIEHSSCCIGNYIYVIAGQSADGDLLKSIE